MVDKFTKQLDGCTYKSGGFNCTCACHAMWLYRASQGKINITACQCRTKTGDRSGGTNLRQMEQISLSYGISTGRVYQPAKFDTLLSLLRTGRYGAHINIHYSSIKGTKYDCFSGGFSGNHDWYCSGMGTIAGTLRIADPGADGRRPGIPNGYQNIPISVVKTAAGRLNLATSGYRALGFGLVYAYVTPPDPATAANHHKARVSKQTQLWNDSSKKWVWIQPVGTVLEVRGAGYPKGGVNCYPVTDGPCAAAANTSDRAGYYVPVSNVKLEGPCA